KKLETERRLERIDQNLLRLADIVEEVESRLRSVRLQAGKARRYREYNERLKQLRTQVAQVDFLALSRQLDEVETELAGLRRQAPDSHTQLAERETQAAEVEQAATQLADLIRIYEARLGANREKIVANESTLVHERRRSVDLDEQISQLRRRGSAMAVRTTD